MEYQLTGTYEAGTYSKRHEPKNSIVPYPLKTLEARKVVGKSIRQKVFILLFGMTPT